MGDKIYSIKGKHILLDAFRCQAKKSFLNDKTLVLTTAYDAVKVSENKIIGEPATHEFDPQGVSVIIPLAESHLSIHTYPEKKYVSVDMYSCGKHAMPEDAIELILRRLSPLKYKMTTVMRGSLEEPKTVIVKGVKVDGEVKYPQDELKEKEEIKTKNEDDEEDEDDDEEEEEEEEPVKKPSKKKSTKKKSTTKKV